MFKNGEIVTTSGQKTLKLNIMEKAFRQLEFRALCLAQAIQKKGFVK